MSEPPKKPIILAVDDDREVLQAVARDVRHGFGERFRIVRAESGSMALDVLRRAKAANESVALVLSDQRMPGMTGVEMLKASRDHYPDAKRVLLTAHADTEVAIAAINDIRLDHYLMKPWDPPETELIPVLDELLEDWLGKWRPPFQGIHVIGHQWSAESHAIRSFLARNRVEHRWLDLATNPDAQARLDALALDSTALPVVAFADGTALVQPSVHAVAERAGIRGTLPEVPLYDVVIVGAGPAGLAASVYAASEGLETLLIEREAAGGQAGTSSRIENYLGFPSGVSGGDLARRAIDQARRFGVTFLLAHEAVALQDHEGVLGIVLGDGSEVRGHSIVIATGVAYRTLDVPGAERLTGCGVYYGAAVSDASAVKGEDVCIVGGANSAGQAALHLATLARNVTMLVRGDALAAGMSKYLVERIQGTPNIRVRLHTAVGELRGAERLESIVLCDSRTNEEESIDAGALFVFIGAVPRTGWLDGALSRDERGFILTGPDVVARGGARSTAWKQVRDPYLLESDMAGVFVAGDVRHGAGRRVATAVGEGAMAVMSIWQHRAQCGLVSTPASHHATPAGRLSE